MRDEAIKNALHPTPETFKSGASFSDGNIVVGVSEVWVAISYNNTPGAENQITVLTQQDARNLLATLFSAGRKQGWVS